jgi:predicted RNase H-like HicB family nuclease
MTELVTKDGQDLIKALRMEPGAADLLPEIYTAVKHIESLIAAAEARTAALTNAVKLDAAERAYRAGLDASEWEAFVSPDLRALMLDSNGAVAAQRRQIIDETVSLLAPLLVITHEDDGSYGIAIGAMPGHVGGGMTLPEAAASAQDAAEAWLDAALDVARDDEWERLLVRLPIAINAGGYAEVGINGPRTMMDVRRVMDYLRDERTGSDQPQTERIDYVGEWQ